MNKIRVTEQSREELERINDELEWQKYLAEEAIMDSLDLEEFKRKEAFQSWQFEKAGERDKIIYMNGQEG
jgi:hypothetical protein